MQELNWNQRFGIIEHFGLTPEQACEFFSIPHNELEAARKLQEEAHLFKPDFNINFKVYEARAEKVKRISDTTEKPIISTTEKPITAPQKKRGRNTHKIKDAYEAIPREKVPVEEFRKEYGVSLSVLRRHKHFDHIKEQGQVRVRLAKLNQKDEERTLCIWRERPDAE